VPAVQYLRRSFRPEVALPPELRRGFAWSGGEPAGELRVGSLAHARTRRAFREPQPPWAPIGAGSTLARFLAHDDGQNGEIVGEELGLAALLRRVIDR
jgi:hypothetical protein